MKITKKSFIFLSLIVATGLSSRVNTAYNGSTGLLETPNARIMKDWSIRAFANHDKYQDYLGFAFTPLPSLELNFNKKSLETVKSKEINAKYLLKREDKIWPAIAIGVENIINRSTYDSKYISISKRYKYLDLTMGLEKRESKKNLFGGIELFINPTYTLLAEYSQKSKINYGIRFNWSNTTSLTASFHDNDIFSIGFNYQFGLATTKKTESNISFQSIEKDDALWCEIEGSDDILDISSASKTLQKVVETTPNKYKTLHATIKHHDIPYKTITVNTKEFEVFLKHNVSNNYMRKAVQIDRKTDKFQENKTDDVKNFNYYISPTLRTILNDKENPFATKASVELGLSYDFISGVFVNANFSHSFYNAIKDINSSNKDKLSYLDYYKYDGTQMKRLTLDIVKKSPQNSFLKAEVGYLDVAFAGVDLEWFKPMYKDRFGLGFEYQRVYKRYVKNMSKVYKDKTYDGKFLNIYYLFSKEKNLHLSANVGEFLAGERGARVDIVRTYKRFSIGGYYYTSQDRRYSDEGIYFKLPLNALVSKNLSGNLDYDIIPSAKGVGQFATTSYSLSKMLESENNLQIMKKEIDLFDNY